MRRVYGDVLVRVIAMGRGAAVIRAGQIQRNFQPGAKEWKAEIVRVAASDLPGVGEPTVEVRAENGELILHMIEVRRVESPARR